jgi:hypothetical protein
MPFSAGSSPIRGARTTYKMFRPPYAFSMENVAAFLVLASYAIAPYLAHTRKRRWWVWLLISLLLGPFSLILLWIKEVNKKKRNMSVFQDAETQLGKETIQEIEETLSKVDVDSSPQIEPANPTMEQKVKVEGEIGWVYILTNPMFPDLTKIGFTTKSVEDRMDQLDSTGLPEPFVEHYRIRCINPKLVESRLHSHFSSKRYKENREFFRISPQEVYEILRKWGVADLEI